MRLRIQARALWMLPAAICLAAPAYARYNDDHNGGPEWTHDNHAERVVNHDQHQNAGPRRDFNFRENDRTIVNNYYARQYKHGCPHGLAKKHNGCVPPGHARHYIVGQPLASTVVYQPVPQPLLAQLQPVPEGYRYQMIDNDLVLVYVPERRVVNSIVINF